MQKSLVLLIIGASLIHGTAVHAQEDSGALIPLLTGVRFDSPPQQRIGDIRFVGLRRISPEALLPKLESRLGDPLLLPLIDHDTRILARTGWFATVRADLEPMEAGRGSLEQRLRVIFYVPEAPFLSAVQYGGSRLLSPAQIEKLLAEKTLTPKLGEPENPVAINQAAAAIREALAELAHPHATVHVIRQESARATVRVRLETSDGPPLPVGRIVFDGNSGLTQRKLKRQMGNLAPDALLASWRGKNAYTTAAFEDDRSQLLDYLQARGYPFARIGLPTVSEYEATRFRWMPSKLAGQRTRLALTIPIEAGALAGNKKTSTAPNRSYVVRQIEFVGLHRFPDRYLRKRIGLREGGAFDDHALESGLRRIVRTGYFKPFKKEDVVIKGNDDTSTLVISIHVEEKGQQRISMLGGLGQFGSTLGIAYSLFNIFDREELLTSKIEGGPETLQLAIGLAKEGFLGSRGSLALSVFDTLMNLGLSRSVKGPFFQQRSEGASASYQYSLTNVDTLSAEYSALNSDIAYSSALTSGLCGSACSDAATHTSSRAVSLGWVRDQGSEQIAAISSVSGGALGGSENLLRSKIEYARILRDPFLSRQNAWAFRTTFSGVASYSGEMPLASRFFAGDAYVRGLHDGDLGPLVPVVSASSASTVKYSAVPAGADLVGAANGEYRWRLGKGTEAAGFFDAGSGALLPNWLGRSRPALLASTNWIPRSSTGVELRWTLPGIGVPLRGYYALNVLRLSRPMVLPDGSIFRASKSWSHFGWGLGSLF